MVTSRAAAAGVGPSFVDGVTLALESKAFHSSSDSRRTSENDLGVAPVAWSPSPRNSSFRKFVIACSFPKKDVAM